MTTAFRAVSAQALSLAMVFAVMATVVVGQSYKADEYDSKLSRKGQIVKRYVKDPTGNSEDKQVYQDYFAKYYFPVMTQSTEDGLENLGKMRYDLFRNFVWTAKPAVQKELSSQALNFAKGVISSGRYHPAVTYNALLILGQIDSRYAGVGKEPIPHADANKLLCVVAQRAAKDAKLPRLMLTGALIGLERHAGHLSEMPQANKTMTVKTLVGVLKTDKLSGDYREGVRGWIYCQAAKALTEIKSTEQTGVFFEATAKRVADESLDLESRLMLASLLEKLNPQPGIAGAATAIEAVQKLALEVSEQEQSIAEQFEELQLQGGTQKSLLISSNVAKHRLQQSDEGLVVLERSGLLATLQKLTGAAKAVAQVAEGDDKSRVDSMLTALEEARRVTADKDVIDLTLVDAIRQMHKQIESATGTAGEADNEALDLDL